jgi:hypothetical protein
MDVRGLRMHEAVCLFRQLLNMWWRKEVLGRSGLMFRGQVFPCKRHLSAAVFRSIGVQVVL